MHNIIRAEGGEVIPTCQYLGVLMIDISIP